MKEYKYYIFDFDGTLVDSSEGIFNCIVYALKEFGIEESNRDILRVFMGPPLFESFKKVYNVSDDDSNWLVEKYRERYRVKACEESVLYDGVKEMLKALKDKGKIVAIASSKPQKFVDEIAEYLGIASFFDFVSAETFNSIHSSKKDLINAVLEHFGNPDKSECIMIGDRFYDIDGANAVGIDSAGAVFGMGEAEELTQAGATYLLNSPDDLLF